MTPDRQEAAITISELGEFGLIAAIQELLPPGRMPLLGAGDDAAVISAPDRRVVATTDLLVEGRHFRRDWSGPVDIGVKAAAQNLADVAAMGAAPTGLLVGLAAPGDLAVDWVLDLMRGLVTECERAGAPVAGGDVTGADTVMLGITALGDLAGADPVTRGGARPGDVLAVAGLLGWSAAGLALLTAGRDEAGGSDERSGANERGGADERSGADERDGADERTGADERGGPDEAGGLAGLIAAHRRPQPPYPAGPRAARHGATSMIDISDGLVQDLGHVAAASGVCIDIETARLPASGPLRAAAERLGATWLDWSLAGGEDHALVATFPSGTRLPEGWSLLGGVRAGSGVLVDSRPWTGVRGWSHFR
jgi:thiamine-monophosphate kinase